MLNIDLNKILVPGIVWYNGSIVEAKTAMPGDGYSVKPMQNGENVILIRFNHIVSIQQLDSTNQYSTGPRWYVELSTGASHVFNDETGQALCLLWKRSTSEGRFTIEHDRKIA